MTATSFRAHLFTIYKCTRRKYIFESIGVSVGLEKANRGKGTEDCVV